VGTLLERLSARQHLIVALAAIALIASSPWIAMVRRIPHGAGPLDYAHVLLGLATLLLAVSYTLSSTRKGRWRLYFPWAAGDLAAVGRDLRDMLRCRVPAAEGGGLFALLEGILLLLLLATAATGAAWFLAQGSGVALAWRQYHALFARGLEGMIVLHVITASLHLLDFVRD
jgi:cytochrome b561